MDLVLATNYGHFVAGVLDRFDVHVMSLWSFGIRRRSALWITRGRLLGRTSRTFLLWRFLLCLLGWRGRNWRRSGRRGRNWRRSGQRGLIFSFGWRWRFLLGALHLFW